MAFYKYAKPKKFKGYRIWACDSTVQLLPNNEETRKIGIHKNQFKEVASVKLSVYFDIFSKMLVQCELFDKRTSDLLCCIKNQVKKVPKDVISIYDRAYGSQILGILHENYGSKYVVRLRNEYSNVVNDFVQSGKDDLIVEEKKTYKTIIRLKELEFEAKEEEMVRYRLVKIVLETGEIEVLMTNLDSSFTLADLYELYGYRWGIETAFDDIKSHQMLGIFSGYSELAVKQDIFCNLIFFNIHTISSYDCLEKVEKSNKRRASKPSCNKKKENQGYKLNRNIGVGILKENMLELLRCPAYKLGMVLKNMQQKYLNSQEMIKPNYKERPRKRIRQNDRHITEMNYKRAM